MQPNFQAGGRFATTRWSLVLAAGGSASLESTEALATLCEIYWYPLYAYIRRRGYPPADAEDLTQGFFALLLDKGYVQSADRTRGRFRTFLLTAASRYLSKERARARARKRGGGRRPLSIDFTAGEAQYQLEPTHNWTPQRLFERRWALTLLARVLAALEEGYARENKSALFAGLKPALVGEEGSRPYAELAAEFDMSEGAVKAAAHRLRRRFRQRLKAEVAATVAAETDVDTELHELLDALRGDA